MGNHRAIGKEKSIPFLNFKLRPEIAFSISAPQSLIHDFEFKANNENVDKSKVFRSFIYDKLGIENEAELRKIPGVRELEDQYRQVILKALKINKGGLSVMIRKEFIEPYINDEK